ncbi:Uncharacterized protein TCM_020688 [Theobroma cacao]|uniref:Uncharacterized protein n=1 Tax=Theobroma cacao TaxID=3641 RepID=A0A061EU25_THECC|nr:Uncharacterized protein TCM_020688 [Theobroma cacao]
MKMNSRKCFCMRIVLRGQHLAPLILIFRCAWIMSDFDSKGPNLLYYLFTFKYPTILEVNIVDPKAKAIF